VIPTILPYWIAPHIGEFRNLFPEVDLQLIEDSTARLVEQLQSGDLDLVVASLPVKNPDIICSEVFREPLLLAVSKDHPLAVKAMVDLRAFMHEPLLLLKEGHCLRDNVLMACTRSKAELRSIFETNQLEKYFPTHPIGFWSDPGAGDGVAARRGLRSDPSERGSFQESRLPAGPETCGYQAYAGTRYLAAKSCGRHRPRFGSATKILAKRLK
jgi:hypothetical protein